MVSTMRSIKDIFRSYAVFDASGRHVNGTDKESNHYYGDAYESLFAEPDPDRDPTSLPTQPHIKVDGCFISTRPNVRLMMEVGIADGSSLLAWSEVFPNALCVGMDIHPAARVDGNNSDRIEFHLGDQRSRTCCERAAGGREFDLIVDDATHHLSSTLLTLFWLWPSVRPGGLYVVEEWDGVSGDRDRIRALWPNAEVVDTVGPSGGVEPLVVFRKPI